MPYGRADLDKEWYTVGESARMEVSFDWERPVPEASLFAFVEVGTERGGFEEYPSFHLVPDNPGDLVVKSFMCVPLRDAGELIAKVKIVEIDDNFDPTVHEETVRIPVNEA